MNNLLERLRTRSWRMTPQRQAVASVLEGERAHLSAEAIHARARTILPEISMATVYNTLNELVAMGEILEVATGSGPKRYDPNTARAHHHLICSSCGALDDVEVRVDGIELGARERHGYLISGMDVVFRGLCPTCQKTSLPKAGESL